MAFLYNVLNIVEELEENENIEANRLTRRHVRDMQDPFTIRDREFLANFRLTKDACMYLLNTLRPHMPNSRRSTRIPAHLRILTALNFFAVGSYQRGVGNNLFTCVSQPMVSRCIKEVSNLLIRYCLRTWIRFPRNDGQKNEAKNRFYVLHGVQQIIGIVDGTHVAIVKPTENENEHVFVNRKGYHSLNVQIICDAQLKIINCLARYPGSSHDSFIWRNSAIGNIMRANYENGDVNTRILGDSGYSCLPWLMVPFPQPRNDREQRFNNTIKRVRSSVERCIGLLKARFRCLLRHRTLHYSPRNAARIVMACVILHNIAIEYNVDEPEPAWDDIDRDLIPGRNPDQEDGMYRQIGQERRQQYVLEYF